MHTYVRQPTDLELAIVQQARDIFDSYAGYGGDVEETQFLDCTKTQILLARWQSKQFGPQPNHIMHYGMVEELGELIEGIESGNDTEIYDAVGDVQVFAAQLCTGMRLDYGTLAIDAFAYAPTESDIDGALDGWTNLIRAAGRLAHVLCKSEQRIRGYENVTLTRLHSGVYLRRFLIEIGRFCYFNAHDMQTIFQEVARTVLKREWTRGTPTTAAP